jgi:DNA-binding CsgD family transcriptional regulator
MSPISSDDMPLATPTKISRSLLLNRAWVDFNEAIGDEAALPISGFTTALPGGDNAGLIATIFPLASGERRSGVFAGMVAVFVQDPVVMPSFPGEAFSKLYGLTRTELRVLLAMAPGLSVKEAAEMLGIGENTAKTHLQHIHSKTGTSKQTELMRLSSMPFGLLLIGPCLFTCDEQRLPQIRESP